MGQVFVPDKSDAGPDIGLGGRYRNGKKLLVIGLCVIDLENLSFTQAC
jgi:hypothetical protein